MDDSDQAGALAYHDLTNKGLGLSKVFIKSVQARAKTKTSSMVAPRQLCEMAVDPWLNSAYQDPQGIFWAGEVCDPVEDDQYGYQIGATLVTDFVTPNWFAHQHALPTIDFKGHATAAFAVLTGGYAQKFDPQKGWQQITGSKAKLEHASRPACCRFTARAPCATMENPDFSVARPPPGGNGNNEGRSGIVDTRDHSCTAESYYHLLPRLIVCAKGLRTIVQQFATSSESTVVPCKKIGSIGTNSHRRGRVDGSLSHLADYRTCSCGQK